MDELLNKKVPHSLEAEQAVLGAMLIDPGVRAGSHREAEPVRFLHR